MCGCYASTSSTYCIKGAAIGRKPEAGPQHGEVLEEACYTLNCVDQHAVAVTHSLRGEGFDAIEDGTGRGTPLVPVSWRENQRGEVELVGGDGLTVQALSTGGGKPGQGYPAIAFHPTQDPIAIHPHCIGRAPNAGPQGKEYLTDGSAYCMDSRGQPQAVAIAWDEELNASIEQAGTLLRGGAGGRHDGVLAPTLTAGNDPSRSPQSSEITAQVAAVFEATAAVALQDVRAINKAQNGRGWNADGTAYTVDTHATQGVATAMQVRRLTPVECERLQGFPDGYTAIPWRGKSASECPDGPRYKALGNSWAVPVVRWIGKRIDGAIRSKT